MTGRSSTKRSAQRAVFIVAPGGLRDSAGIGRLVKTIARVWTRDGVPFRVVDPYGPAVLPIAPLFFARALLQIVWNVARRRVRLLHVHMADGGSIIRKGVIVRLGVWLAVPVIVHIHGSAFEKRLRDSRGFMTRWFRRTLLRADRILVLGKYWQRLLADGFAIAPDRVLVLPNAVEGPASVPRRVATVPCRILFLGRMEHEKGLPELLEALSDTRLAQLEWSLLVAGAGERDTYRRRAATLGLADRVDFRSWAPEAEVRTWLSEGDVFVLPSHREGLSMALLEAMAFGLAVITTPVGGNAEAVVDGISGLFVPVADRGALAAALVRVIADRPLRETLQTGARRQFEDHFEIAAYCRRLDIVYREVCGDS